MPNKLKPCPLCGESEEKPFLILDKSRRFSLHRWYCQIICENFKCGNYSVATGITKNRAHQTAIKIWNKEAERLSKLPQWIRHILK